MFTDKTILHVQGIGPSLSGATRIKIILKDLTERHFYMKADGSLFIPPGHKTNMFKTQENSKKEWDWVQKTWLRPGSEAKFIPRLPMPQSAMAVDLCNRLEADPDLYSRALYAKLKADDSRVPLGNAFSETFSKIKKNLPENRVEKFNKKYEKKAS